MTAHLRRGAVAVLIATALAAGLAIGGASAPASAYDEGTIVSLVNQSRAANGLSGLVSNPSLDAVALGWAEQLASSGTLSHNPSVGEQIPGGWTSWGENVAQGFGSGPAVHDGWMNSSGHRANILGEYTDIGVALIEGGGTTWAVEVFATYPGSGGAPPPAPEAAPAPAADPAPAPEAPVDAATAAPTPSPTPEAVPAPTATPTATATSDPSSAATTTRGRAAGADGALSASGVSRAVPWWPWAVGAGLAVLVALSVTLRRARGARDRSDRGGSSLV